MGFAFHSIPLCILCLLLFAPSYLVAEQTLFVKVIMEELRPREVERLPLVCVSLPSAVCGGVSALWCSALWLLGFFLLPEEH